MEQIILPPEEGIELTTYNATLDGFAAGVAAAVQAAKRVRLDQIVQQVRQKKQPEAPKE